MTIEDRVVKNCLCFETFLPWIYNGLTANYTRDSSAQAARSGFFPDL